MYHIASCSFGKDSLAMILRLIEENKPLDEVVFYDTGMEFQAIYDARDKLLPILQGKGIKYTELRPKHSFLWSMFEKPHKGKHDGIVRYGYGWCGGMCRWGTHDKLVSIDKYVENNMGNCYIGIASDEKKRIEKERSPYKIMPLVDFGMTEKDCLEYCYSKGFYWEEKGIRLYDVLDRVSCWCCCNKNKKELYNIWRYLPHYWERLKELQSKIDRPMKKFQNKQYGFYGNVFDMEKVFEQLKGGANG